MGNNNKHARKILLQEYELAVIEIMQSTCLEEFYMRTGRLVTLANILQKCNHNGDGTDPIAKDQWNRVTFTIVTEAREKLRKRREGIQND